MEKMNIKWNYTNKIVNDLLKINRAREIVDLLEIPVSVEEEIKKETIAKRVHYSTKIEGNSLDLNTVKKLEIFYSGANGENRTHTPKPERDFKSRASTYSATLAQNLRTFLSFHLNWTGIIVAFFLFVKSFLKKFKNFNFYTI